MPTARDDGLATGTAPSGRRSEASDADSPRKISAAGWRRILRRTLRHVVSDRLMVQSAAVAFFAILSIAPVFVTAISVYRAVSAPEQARQQLSGLARMLPAELRPMVAEQLTTITAASNHLHTWNALTGLVLALWTAATAMTYLIDGLTLAYHETETRSFLRRSRLALLFIVGGVLLLGALVTGARTLSTSLNGAPHLVRTLAPIAAWVLLAVLMTGVLAVLYRWGPDRKEARWRWTTGGSTVATLLWLVTTLGFFTYVERLGSYRSTYGSLAGVAISMFWLWATVFLVIVGAAVNGETERETTRDSTIGPDQPLGERGAVVADSAPPYPGEG
jgi:membrane protein